MSDTGPEIPNSEPREESTVVPNAPNQQLRSSPSFVRYIYSVRAPLLAGFIPLGFCAGAFFGPAGIKALLGNAFDLDSGIGILLVLLTTCLVASAVIASYQLILAYSPERLFDSAIQEPTDEERQPTLAVAVFLVLTLPVLVGVISKSTTLATLWELLWAGGGYLAFVLLFVTFLGLQALLPRRQVANLSPSPFSFTDQVPAKVRNTQLGLAKRVSTIGIKFLRYPPIAWIAGKLGPGYFEYDDNGMVTSIRRGHVAAIVLIVLTLVPYVGIGLLDLSRVAEGHHPYGPTLAYVMLLATIFCWTLSGLTFFLDRYRIPVLIPLVALWFVQPHVPGLEPDSYYPVAPRPVVTENTRPDPADSIIVVAANGGGIQSAAWAARVLTGLEEQCASIKCDPDFSKSIRLISSVSGGSVGTMYFVNEYEKGSIPEDQLRPADDLNQNQIVHRAEQSSLDYAAWGLVFPDLVRSVAPISALQNWDRGRALEQSWLRADEQWNNRGGIEQGLSEWQADAEARDRPAVIFNTTIAETGKRLPLTTTDLPTGSPGRLNFDQYLKGYEPTIATAARLSAAYPYISPAARANFPEELKEDEQDQQGHLVDGGYYDNYGVSSLVEWLDAKLEKDRGIKRILIIEIRGAHSDVAQTIREGQNEEGAVCPTSEPTSHDEETQDKEDRDGWLFQAVAPALTVYNIRDAGQTTHNEVELDLLIDKWKNKQQGRKVAITRAAFEYDGEDPPLSWHLTRKDKQNIEGQWEQEVSEEPDNDHNTCAGWKKVKSFLTTETK